MQSAHPTNLQAPSDHGNATPLTGSAAFDVDALIDSSQPQGRRTWLMPVVGTSLLLFIAGSYWSGRANAQLGVMIDLMSGAVMIAIGIAMAFTFHSTVRRHRAERAQLEAISEMVQLRRWDEAARALQSMLSQPTRTMGSRVQALIFLSITLARLDRFVDAIHVQNYLLDTFGLDAGTDHALRLGRTMAMLREDHLFDADRAISDLRRRVSRAKTTGGREIDRPADDVDMEEAGDLPEHSMEEDLSSAADVAGSVAAGLVVVEMYRDVKTGHPAEALSMFASSLPMMRRQLGHRLADAFALAAAAQDSLGQHEGAQANILNASRLAPWPELQRRFPELKHIPLKYKLAIAPAA